MQVPATISVRWNPHKSITKNGDLYSIDQHFPGSEPIPWEPMGRYLSDRPVFTLDPLFHAGIYYVQEASSMIVGRVAKTIRDTMGGNVKILDLCAAPGGKSTHLLSLMRPDDLIVSNEVIRARASILTENLIKWGAPNSVATSNDPEHFVPLGQIFDLIIVDAPCSGEGLFRKDPAAIGEWSPTAVDHCALRQQRILSAIWSVLKPGGCLIYSTCTFNRKENDEQAIRLVSEVDAVSERVAMDDFIGVREDEIKITANDTPIWIYRCLPDKVRGEGLTFSVLRKPVASKFGTALYESGPKNRFHPKNRLKVKSTTGIASALDDHWEWAEVYNEKKSWSVPEQFSHDISLLSEHLYIVHAGIESGDLERPPHSISMSSSYRHGYFNEIEIDHEMALRYLRRESIPSDKSLRGIHVVTYQGIPLGFGKAVNGRINNHYPMEWRIRMR